MQRRRLGLALMLAAFAVLIAVKPKTGALRLSIDTGNESMPIQAQAALQVGMVAVSILIHQAGETGR